MTAACIGGNILCLLVALYAGYGMSRRLRTRTPGLTLENALRHAPALGWLVASLLLAILAFMLLCSSPVTAWRFPVWWAFYNETLVWGMLLFLCTFGFSLTVGLAFGTRHAERWKVVAAGVLVVLALQGMQWQYSHPVAPYLTSVLTPDGMVLQSSGSSCAAASGANIVQVFGLAKSERDMAELFGTTTYTGTSVAQVIYGMRHLGITAQKVEIMPGDLARLATPAMLFVDHPLAGPEAHAVAYMGWEQGQAAIWDPLSGKTWLSQQALARIWHGRGLTFAPPARL